MVNYRVGGELSKVKYIADEIKECWQVTISDDIRMASRIKVENIYVYCMNYKRGNNIFHVWKPIPSWKICIPFVESKSNQLNYSYPNQ